MRQAAGFSIALAGLLAVAPAGSLAQNKDKKNGRVANEQATPQDYAQLAQAKQIAGRLASVDGRSRTITFTIEIPHTEPNPNYKQNAGNANQYRQLQQQLNRQLQQGRGGNNQNPAQRQQQMARARQQAQQQQRQQLAKMYQNKKGGGDNLPFKVVTTVKSFDLEVENKVVVRKLFVVTEYDDVGNLKQYTPGQLAEMKGKDATKPGYAAKYDELQPGQEVILHLAPPQAGVGKKGDDAARPTVRMIVMTREAAGMSAGDAGNKKK